jgi:hypothetical protein
MSNTWQINNPTVETKASQTQILFLFLSPLHCLFLSFLQHHHREILYLSLTLVASGALHLPWQHGSMFRKAP